MASDGRESTDTTLFPPIASKTAMLQKMNRWLNTSGPTRNELLEASWELSNTDTSEWSDPTARGESAGLG